MVCEWYLDKTIREKRMLAAALGLDSGGGGGQLAGVMQGDLWGNYWSHPGRGGWLSPRWAQRRWLDMGRFCADFDSEAKRFPDRLSRGGFPGGSVVKKKKKPACQWRKHRLDPWVRKISWRGKWQPTPVFLSGKSHGQRSLAGYSPWGCKRIEHDLATKTTKLMLKNFTCI